MRLARALAFVPVPAVLPVAAETLVSAREFETWPVGKTLGFANATGIFGTEEYLPGRRVRWAGTDGQCLPGHWVGDKSMVCFAYEGDSITARSVHDLPEVPPRRVTEARQPLSCTGPAVGV